MVVVADLEGERKTLGDLTNNTELRMMMLQGLCL